MKKPAQWLTELATVQPDPGVEILSGRDGSPTMKVNGVMMHSRYQPVEDPRTRVHALMS